MPVFAPYGFHAFIWNGASRGTGMKNTPVTQTLKSLIKQKIKEKGLSRSELVAVIGYTNISKGCNRLDAF
jgi:hypothetical protein